MDDSTHEYAFDCTLVVSLRVKALSEDAARKVLSHYLDSADANLGAWADGSPILAEVSLVTSATDPGPFGRPRLYEIDGEAT